MAGFILEHNINPRNEDNLIQNIMITQPKKWRQRHTKNEDDITPKMKTTSPKKIKTNETQKKKRLPETKKKRTSIKKLK